MTAGTMLLCAALFLLLYNRNEDSRAESKTAEIVNELKEQMPEPHMEESDPYGMYGSDMDVMGTYSQPDFTQPFSDENYTPDVQSQNSEIQTTNGNINTIPEPDIFAEYEDDNAAEEPEVYYYVQELSYMGLLSIPSLGLELPVMSDWSYPNLRIAPCRYSGTVADGNMIIAAHNYRSHFGRISELDSGDEIIFTDGSGVMHKYSVVQSDIVNGKDPAGMEAGSEDWDLTLFTCTYSGQSRVTVRAVLAE